VEEGLRKYLDDNVQAWEMDADGRYTLARPNKGEAPRCAQLELLQELASAIKSEPESAPDRLRPRRKAKAAA
jgi:polyphosphate kinase